MLLLASQTEIQSREREACSVRGIFTIPIFVVPLLLALSVALGCAAVVTPIKPGADDSINQSEGLVLGRIHVTGSGKDSQGSPEQPLRTSFHVQWRIAEEASGKVFVVDGLPSDGPFVLKLPTGSYRLTAFSFNTALGVWQASLPATFDVSSRKCTYLGTWQLHLRAGFFDGSVSRQVFDQHALAENDLRTVFNARLLSPMVPQLSLAMESPLILTFRTQGTDLTSPP